MSSNNNSSNMPVARYPPMMTTTSLSRPSSTLQTQHQPSRSNMVTQPQFSANPAPVATDATSLNSPTTSPKSFRFPPKIKFFGKETLACINCSTDQQQTAASTKAITSSSVAATVALDNNISDDVDRTGTYMNYARKLGPVLMELRNISLNNHDEQGHDSIFSMEGIICRSRGNPSLGTSVSSTCLDVCGQEGSLSSSRLCATGLSTGALCIHSFSMHDMHSPSQLQYYSSLRQHRPATAVAWRPNNMAQVAIGLQSSSTNYNMTNNSLGSSGNNNPGTNNPAIISSSTSGRGGVNVTMGSGHHHHHHFASRGGAGANAGAAGGEFCCFVWDIEQQQQQLQQQHKKSVPLYKLSHQMPVSCLAWFRQMDHTGGDILAIGSRTLQLYDLRSSSASKAAATPPVSVFAHSTGVQGMAVASTSWQLATWAMNEPVKIWDVRRFDAGAVSEIKIASPVQAVEWSESGVLVLASGNSAFEYDVTGGRPILANTVYSKESIVDFALYPYGVDSETSTTSKNMVQEWFPYRMAVVHADRTVHDLARIRNAPVALSWRDGRIAHSFGRTLWMGSTASGPTAMEGAERSREEDISANMMRRARCLHVAKYSMDTDSNIKMLSEDAHSNEEGPTKVALLRLWNWIERVEDLCSSDGEEPWVDGSGSYWPAKGLLDAGVWLLLGMDSNDYDADSSSLSEELCCTTYDSATRRAALASCGWASKFDMFNVLGECEELGEFERSAALAVWHGNLGAAVDALQRGADHARREGANEKTPANDNWLPQQYAETMERISLCIAGFRGGDAESASSRVWRKACANLLTRLQTNDSHIRGNRVGYIRCVLKFLMKIGYGGHYEEVLGDLSLSLCDRIGFACRFLPRNDLKVFLRSCIDDCQTTGNVEGLAITGLDSEGVKILQSYVDRYADVQTAALVTSRVNFPSVWAEERRIAAEWLYAYRGLLNTWQMWQSRAMFDVDRAELLTKVKAKQVEMQSGGLGRVSSLSKSKSQPVRRSAMRPPDPEVQASVPAQLDARCNYCSCPLGLKQKDSNPNAWLSKMNPIISCCPQCRKPLPRCAICMLSLGTLNPYFELTKPKDQASSNLPFAEWFTWCLRCKHGGHAHHMVGWFANQDVCPVSGCDCHCQFDGVNKLTRPALSSSTIPMANDHACN